MNKQMIIAAVATASLIAPQALSQDANGGKLAECRLPFREAIALIIKRPILKRESDDSDGGISRTIFLSPVGIVAFGQPLQEFSVTKVATGLGQSDSIISKVALDYSAMAALLPKAFGKAKCDATGTAFTYCSMTLPIDTAAKRAVNVSVEPVEGGGTTIVCSYQKMGS